MLINQVREHNNSLSAAPSRHFAQCHLRLAQCLRGPAFWVGSKSGIAKELPEAICIGGGLVMLVTSLLAPRVYECTQ